MKGTELRLAGERSSLLYRGDILNDRRLQRDVTGDGSFLFFPDLMRTYRARVRAG
jgi:hypothetical protein